MFPIPSINGSTNPLILALNSAAKIATTMTAKEMAAILYGFAHHESQLGNDLPTSGSGIFNYLKDSWLSDVQKYGNSIAGLESIAAQLKSNPTVAIRQQVSKLRTNNLLAAKVLVKNVELYLIPTLRANNYPITIGSIWNLYHSPATVGADIANKFNWDSVDLGYKYVAKYYK